MIANVPRVREVETLLELYQAAWYMGEHSEANGCQCSRQTIFHRHTPLGHTVIVCMYADKNSAVEYARQRGTCVNTQARNRARARPDLIGSC